MLSCMANTNSAAGADAGTIRRMHLTARDIEMLEAGLDEDGAMVSSRTDILRILRLRQAGLVQITSALPGTPYVYVTTLAGVSALGAAR